MRESMSKWYRSLLLLLIGGMVLSFFCISSTPIYAQSDTDKDLLETASEAGNFRVLVALLKAADLDETLEGEGPFTIFAPTDTAFTKIPLPKIRELRNDPDGALTEVLLMHGVSGNLSAVDIVAIIDGEGDNEASSLNDIPLVFTDEDGVVSVNGAAIITTDIEASNGIIHVLDTVLVPPALQDAQADAESGNDDADSDNADGDNADSGAMDSEDVDADSAAMDSEDADSEDADSEDADSEDADSEDADSEDADSEDADGEEADSEDADSEDADSEEADGEEADGEDNGPGNMDGEDADNAMSDDADADDADADDADADDADADDADADDTDADDADADDADADSEDAGDTDVTEEADSEDTDSEESAGEDADGEDADDASGDDTDSEAMDSEDGAESAASAPARDLIDTASTVGNFTSLVAAIYTADLVDTLRGEGPFTVFAPSDAVFSALPSGSIQEMLEMPQEDLADQLLLHVMPGELLATDLVDLVNSDLETVSGRQIPLQANETGLTVGGAVIVATNIKTSNGIIHVIDNLLSDETVAAASAEAASAAQPVAEPTAAQTTAQETTAQAPTAGSGADLVDTAVAAGNFNTLVAALTASGLDEVLRTGGSFTIFAPTDEAFAALPEGTVDTLLADPTGGLTDLLLYHTVEGLLPAEYIISIDGSALRTVGGDQLAISVPDEGTVLINEASVMATDIAATNGLIHVIDRVLIRPAAPAESAAPASAPAPVAVPTVPPAAAAPAPVEIPTVPPAPTTAAPLAAPTAAPAIAPTVAPAAVAAEAEQEFNCLVYYTVDPGDTLAQIAALYASSISLLAEANDVTDIDDIKIGQRLCIVR